MIRAEAERRTAAARSPYVVQVVPLLLESGDYRRRVARVAVVDAPEEIQIKRVMARSALPEREVRRIMAHQASRAARLAAADDVIDNSGTLEALRHQVGALHAKYLKLASGAQSGAKS
jgi:dephospho-CoA kinase